MGETDKQLATRALQTQSTAHYFDGKAALREVEPLREQVGSGGGVERERADAWLAICVLCNTLRTAPRGPMVNQHCEKAIEKTAAWHESIK